MSVYTITLTPDEDAALRARAMQSGRSAEELLDQAVRAQFIRPAQAAPPSDEALLAEYHALTDLEMAGHLTAAQAVRLKAVQTEMDDRDAVSPEARWMYARMAETSDMLDKMLQAVRDLAATRHEAQ